MLSAIFQVYQFYKSDKKLLGTTVSRQKSLIQFQFSSLFSDLIILINTPKKVFKCAIPINITPLECFQLYFKSKKPIKVTESYWEQLFQQVNASNAKKEIPSVKKNLNLQTLLGQLVSDHKNQSLDLEGVTLADFSLA